MDDVSEERPTKRLKTSVELNNKSQDGISSLVTSSPSQNSVLNVQAKAVLDKERSVGISAFVRKDQPLVFGTVKQRFTDFLVNEVIPDGTVLHLHKTSYDVKGKNNNDEATTKTADVEPPATDDAVNSKKAPPDPSQAEPSTPATVSTEDREQLIRYLSEDAVEDLLKLFASIAEHPKKRSRDHPVVKTSFTSDRTVRTEIHQAIRRIFNSKIESSTNKDGVLVLSAANPNSRNNHKSNKPQSNKLSWVERGGEYCHFTLYKEMKDTMESISFLAYLLQKNPRDFQFAGTKDRRAATVQRISVWRVEAERLAALNRNPTMRNGTLGDFEHRPSGLALGDLAGNEFTITVRDLHASHQTLSDLKTSLEASLSSLQTNGFINYYGLQRFGTFAISSDVLGLQILKADFEGTCNSLLDYNPDALAEPTEDANNDVGRDDRARAQAIKIFRETNSIREALAIMPKRFSAETAIVRALGRNPNDHLGALMQLQRNMRQMYVHAYQSLIWNQAASNRWKLYGDKVVEGDLVLVHEHVEKESKTTNGGAAATDPAAEPIEAIDPEDEIIIHAASPAPTQSHLTKSSPFERARPLTALEASSNTYTIFDIVLPLPGFDILYPSNPSGEEFYKTTMAKDGLDPHDMRRPQKDFSLSGSYRKILGRIGEGWEVSVRAYTRVDEQFVVTERERLDAEKQKGKLGRNGQKNGEKQDQATISATNAGAQSDSNDGSTLEKLDGKEQQEEQEQKTAAILKFQLATSQYATMALRELARGGLVEYKPGFSGGR